MWMWTNEVYLNGEKQRKGTMGGEKVLNIILSLGKFWDIMNVKNNKEHLPHLLHLQNDIFKSNTTTTNNKTVN